MKLSLLLPLLALPVVGLIPPSVSAAVVFQEDFDNTPPYTDNAALPTGFDKINYGRWMSVSGSSNAGVSSTATSLSGSRSLLLEKGSKNNSRAHGEFGMSSEAAEPVTDSLVVRLAFNMDEGINTFFFSIRDSAHREYAKVTVGNSKLSGIFNGAGAEIATLAAGSWYTLEFVLPVADAEEANYTINLYGADGSSPLGSVSGAYASSLSTGGYALFYTGHDNAGAVYLDNISAVTGIPEASTVSYLLIAGAAGGAAFWRARRR